MDDSSALVPSASRSRASRRWWPFLALSGVALLFFWQYFLLDQTLYAGDTAFVFFPFRNFATQRLMEGQIPLWNPYIFGGTPALAESQYQVFYWPNLLFWITGVARGIGWTLPLHLLWLSAGVYLFVRRALGLGKVEALVAAVAFSYGGSVQGRLGIPVYTQAASWMPWILLGYDFARRRGGLSVIWPGGALAMQLLTGAPQYTFYSLVILAGFHLFRLKNTGESDGSTPRKAWWALGATLVLGVTLIAAQLLPEWELARLSDRGTRASYEYAVSGSLSPRHLLTMVLPKFYGLYSTQARDGFLPSTEIGYVGVLTLALAVAAWFSPRQRLARFWALMAVLATALALGGNNPLYPFLYRWVPGIGMFRQPGAWLLVTSFSLAMLAALGLETLRVTSERRLIAARFSTVFLGIMAILCAILLVSPSGSATMGVVQTPFGPWLQVVWMIGCAAPIAVLALSKANFGIKWQRGALCLMPALIALDLWFVSQDMEMQQTLSVAAVEAPSPTAQMLKTGAGAERFWSGSAQVPMEKWIAGDTNSQISALEHRAQAAMLVRALMPSCLPTEFNALGLTGAWGALMPLRRHARPIYTPGTPPAVQANWLRLLSVRTHLSPQPLDNAGFSLQSSEPLYIYRDDLALPHGFWVPTARSVAGEEAVDLLSQPNFDPRRQVLLENAPQTPRSAETQATTPSFDPNAVRLVSYEAQRVVLETNAPRSGYVVLMDTAFPGWHARIDGTETPLQIANWMGRAVPVASGRHRVEMWFEPASVRFGTFLSLLTFGAIATAASAVFFARRAATSSLAVSSRRD